MYRYSGDIPGWEFPENGQFSTLDYKIYFTDSSRYPFLIKVNEELAGFALIHKIGTSRDIDWNMGEFFILAKFQGTSVAGEIVYQIWDKFPGEWEVAVIPENKRAVSFWRKVIENYSQGSFQESIKTVDYDSSPGRRIFFRFSTKNHTLGLPLNSYQWQIKDFNALTKNELYQILKFRMEIFILEQNSIYLDLDNEDQHAFHFIGKKQKKLIAYGRVTFNASETHASIRRVSIHKDYRKKQLGSEIMEKMLAFIQSKSTVSTVELDAQYHLQKFYEKYGFKTEDMPYEDGGVLHIKMIKKIKD